MEKVGIVLAVLFLSMTPFWASAQSLGNQPDPLQFLVAPDVPQPGDTVVIEAQGVGDFLGDATITWQLGGKTVKSGLGERIFSFTAGPLGSQSSVKVIIDSPARGVITKNFTFLPSLVNMLWEADTSVPPWYRGKALYTAGSTLTITAFPQIILRGASVTSNNLSFNWKRNGKPLPQSSGKGRNQITIKGSQLLPGETVAVDVLAGTAILAHGEIVVPASKPQIFLYNRDPLRGVLYDRALAGTVQLTGAEITVQAVPYFFSNSSISAGTVPYVWQLNNEDTSGPQTAEGLLTLRQAGSGAGSALLNVSMQNNDADKYVQSAAAALRILFGGSASASTLGL